MPYNDDGFYVEAAPEIGKDADRRCAAQARDLEARIERLDAILERHRYGSKAQALDEQRTHLIVELHDMRRARLRELKEEQRRGYGDNQDAITEAEWLLARARKERKERKRS